MKTEKIKSIIENSDMVKMQKNIAIGFITRAEMREKENSEDRLLIEQVSREKHISEVLYTTDKVKIYSVNGKNEWGIKYPIRSIFLNKKDTWERSCTVSPDFDTAFLCYLEKRHIGDNTDFTFFALRMLGIELEE